MKNWVVEAAEEIAEEQWFTPDGIAQIIREYCPLKEDVAYMLVPRCEMCQHWSPIALTPRYGTCLLLQHGNYARDLAISRLAVADGAEYPAGLTTQDGFGCVQWKER